MEIAIREPAKIDTFVTIFQHTKLFAEHIQLFFHDTHLFMQLLDKSRVSIFEVHLPAHWFDEYNYQKEGGGIQIGMHSGIFFKIMHTCEKGQEIHIRYDEEENDKLFIDFSAAPGTATSTKTFEKHFEMPLMDIDAVMMEIPEIEYQAEFALPSATFAGLVTQFKLFGETLNILCSEEQIQMSALSVEAGKMSVDIPIDDLHSFAIEESQTLELSFSLLHLQNICAYSKIAKHVGLFITRDYPIKVVYELGQPQSEGVAIPRLVYYLAPKVNDS
jgi:proliferating cell nuclear antigen PCNA